MNRLPLPSFTPLARAALDASDEVASRMKAYDALAALLHELRDPNDFGCLTPAALEQLLSTVNAGMREAVASMNQAIDNLVAAGKAATLEAPTMNTPHSASGAGALRKVAV